MTKEEFTLLLKQFKDRRDKAIELHSKLKNEIHDTIQRNYLQGGIDTLTTIIESLEKRYNELTKK